MRNAETADADESRIGQTFGSDAARAGPSVESLPAGKQCPITPDDASGGTGAAKAWQGLSPTSAAADR